MAIWEPIYNRHKNQINLGNACWQIGKNTVWGTYEQVRQIAWWLANQLKAAEILRNFMELSEILCNPTRLMSARPTKTFLSTFPVPCGRLLKLPAIPGHCSAMLLIRPILLMECGIFAHCNFPSYCQLPWKWIFYEQIWVFLQLCGWVLIPFQMEIFLWTVSFIFYVLYFCEEFERCLALLWVVGFCTVPF